MNNLTESYIGLLTIVIFVFGFIYGAGHVFATLRNYEAANTVAYDIVCKESFGEGFRYYDVHVGTGKVTCESGLGTYTIKKQLLIGLGGE